MKDWASLNWYNSVLKWSAGIGETCFVKKIKHLPRAVGATVPLLRLSLLCNFFACLPVLNLSIQYFVGVYKAFATPHKINHTDNRCKVSSVVQDNIIVLYSTRASAFLLYNTFPLHNHLKKGVDQSGAGAGRALGVRRQRVVWPDCYQLSNTYQLCPALFTV